ncbi:MAG: M48 family metallopeptidase [Proteobacteria bacterium]|nr:M48 family metallopeptidase [Pseudomonadota bacterium]
MNFFEQQAAARRASTRLVVLFVLAVVAIVAAVDVVAWGMTRSANALVFFSVVTVATIGLGSLYRIASLGNGGDAVAQQLGGVAVPEDTIDPGLRRLRNVIEEISIASGVPVPRIYVLEHESAINAFAAGYAPSDAVIAVTRGALDRLNRDELQGVVAHEFSHILNGDMRLNIRLIGVLFGILMIGLVGRKILVSGNTGARLGRGIGIASIAALAALVIGYVGLFFARMIKAGVSRSRESLADASAVQFTRQTTGLAGALKKIAGVRGGSLLDDRGEAEEVSHMLFGDGVGFSGLFATHPPLLKRIQALDPSFRGEELERLKATWRSAPPNGMQEDLALGFDEERRHPLPDVQRDIRVTPTRVAAQVALPGADDYRRADTIAGAIPEALRDLAAHRESVMALLLALLIDSDEDLAARQQHEIAARLGDEVGDHALRVHQQLVADLHPMLRMPLAALAFPVLRLRPRPQLDAFMAAIDAVVKADDRVSLFEYCLGRLLTAQVIESLEPARHARIGWRKLDGARNEVALLLAVVAQAGNTDPLLAQRAYLAGMQHVFPQQHPPYAPPAQGVLALDQAWEALDALHPLAKQSLVEAVTAAISHDDRVDVAEAELLRTICAVLHCPLPPMLER